MVIDSEIQFVSNSRRLFAISSVGSICVFCVDVLCLVSAMSYICNLISSN